MVSNIQIIEPSKKKQKQTKKTLKVHSCHKRKNIIKPHYETLTFNTVTYLVLHLKR